MQQVGIALGITATFILSVTKYREKKLCSV